MPKLILQANISLNGYMCRPDGALDFMAPWDDDLNTYISNLTDSVDHILMGRKLAESFIPHWRSNPSNHDQKTIDQFNNMKKMIFTKTLKESPWGEPTQLATGELVDEVVKLKTAEGSEKDLIVYGGATFVQSLIERCLVDEFHLIVHPISLKEGRSVFTIEQKLELIKTTSFGSSIVVLHYQRRV